VKYSAYEFSNIYARNYIIQPVKNHLITLLSTASFFLTSPAVFSERFSTKNVSPAKKQSSQFTHLQQTRKGICNEF